LIVPTCFLLEVLFMLRAVSLALTIFALVPGSASADAPVELGANAALKYWQAFAQLPKFTEALEHKFREECLTMPLDAHAREIVAGADYALRWMHRGAALPKCDWGLGYEDGAELLLPHAQAARTLSDLAFLRARIRLESGDSAGAIEDIVDAMALGRHVSMDGTLITVLLNYAIESRAGETLALYLPKLSAQELKSLKARLAVLPPSGSPAVGLVPFEEQAGLDWFIRKIKEQKDKETMLDFVTSLCSRADDTPDQRRERASAFIEGCGGTQEGVLKMAEETRPCYTLTAKMLELPLDQFEKEFAAEAKKRDANPVFKMLFPAASSLRRSQARAEVRRALLATAIDVQLDGPDALKRHVDPVAGGPFELVAFEGGFELRSKFDSKDEKRWGLVVGRRGK
jgi:hypothetical protein